MVKVERSSDSIIVKNGFWQVRHDLQRGGCIAHISFVKGTNENVLAKPLELRVNEFTDLADDSPEVRVHKTSAGYRILVSGRLRDRKNGKRGVNFIKTYDYQSHCVRLRVTLKVGDLSEATKVTSLSVAFRPACKWVETGPSLVGKEPKKPWTYVRGKTGGIDSFQGIPLRFGAYSTAGNGVQFYLSEKVPRWFGPEFTTPTFSVRRTPSGNIEMELAHTRVAPKGSLHGEGLEYELMMAPTNFRRPRAFQIREAVICSKPFPTDRELETLAHSGVNLIRIHEGANWKDQSENFWYDGVYPPYQGEILREMKRVLKTCHRLGMRIIPYFCFSECHPLSPAFRRAKEWQSKDAPDSYLRFSCQGLDQVYGVLFCTASGWGNWLYGYIKKVVAEFGFDGIYLDGTQVGSCCNDAHGEIPHTSVEGHLRIMESFRRQFPKKMIVLHQTSFAFNVAHCNLADHIVTYEELALGKFPRAKDLPISLRIQTACVSTAIVPGIFCPRDGKPLAPSLYFFNYFPGKEPTATKELLRKGVPSFLVNGNVPYSYYFNETMNWGYRKSEDRLNDKVGIYALFRKLAALENLRGMSFPWHESPFRSSSTNLRFAAVRGGVDVTLLAANESGRAVKSVAVRAKKGFLDMPAKSRLSITEVEGQKLSLSLTAKQLEEGFHLGAMAPWSYRIFQIRPARP